jgi:hypothetical protein
MPALLILAVISWLLGTGKPRPKADGLPLFTILELRPKPRWRVFFFSAVSHTVCVILLFLLSDLVSGSRDDDYLARQIAGHSLVIKLPEHIYLAPAEGHNPSATARLQHSQRVSERRKDLRKYADTGSQAKSTASPSPRQADMRAGLFSIVAPAPAPLHAEPRKFELPDLPVHQAARQTILQAELPVDIPPPLDRRLPNLVFWDSDPAKAPDHPIEPGNLTARLQPPRLNSTPRLEAPNRESLTSDLRVASTPVATWPHLPLPAAATTMPIRLLEPADKTVGPTSIDPFTGNPVHVLAVSPDPAPLTDALKALFIPAGNQLARLPGFPPMPGFSALGDGSDDSGASSGDAQSGTQGGGAFGSPELLHALPGDGHIFGLLSPAGLNGTPLRILHPAGGVFDVVVVQTSTSDAFSEGAQALSGRPIYTVYLEVGAPKEWILQYCVPNMAGPVQTGSLVSLGNPDPMSAPYPTVTVRPPEDWQHGSGYLLVHGFLDETGHLRDMKILASQDPQAPTTDALLEYLPYWEFRPAVVDGRPVKVEVILAVPPDRVS